MSMLLAGVLMTNAAEGSIPTSGLDVQWTMDNISGSTLVDDQGNADGTITGATAVSGHIGDALSFSAASHVVTSTFFATTVKTFSFWIKTSTSGVIQIIYENSTNTNTVNNSFVIYIASNNSIAINYRSNTGNIIVCTLTTPYSVTDGSYHHVRLFITPSDTSSNQVQIWVDDVSRPVSYSATRSAFSFVSRTTYMGQRAGGASPLTGDLDQWREYSRSLSDSEGTQLYTEA